MAPKTIIITGGTGGIGYQIALALASLPEQHTIVITGRSPASAQAAVASIQEKSKNSKIEYALGDLSVKSHVQNLGMNS